MDKTNPPADKCYFCGEWYEEVALGIKAVKDQGGGMCRSRFVGSVRGRLRRGAKGNEGGQMTYHRRIWLFLRIVWRGKDNYLPERIDIKTAWKWQR